MTHHRTRIWPVLAVLLCLLLAGALLFADQGKRLARLVWPCRYAEQVEFYAAEYTLDPRVVYAVIRTESGFDPKAESDAGARGLMQITEETFDWIKRTIAPNEALTFDDLYDPACNIRFGTYFLSACLTRYQNDLPTAAAAYHSGWGTVDALLENSEYSPDNRLLTTFPYPQMRRYVEKVTKNYAVYQHLYP